MSKPRNPGARRFLEHLERARELRRQVVTGPGLAAQQATLSRWQSERLASTYADLASQRRYRMAIEFFLSDLYGTKDFAQRDADLLRIYPILIRVLSENALESMATAVELHALSQELDSELLQVLRNGRVDIGKNPDRLDRALYARAYRRCDNYDQRVRQIELIQETGRLLDEVVHHPLIMVSARIVRAPAHAAGLGELQDFIERGMRAFKRMKGATHFLQTIRDREYFVLDQIYSGEPLTDWSVRAWSSASGRSFRESNDGNGPVADVGSDIDPREKRQIR